MWSYQIYLFLFFSPCLQHVEVPRSEIEPKPLGWQHRILTHSTTGELLFISFDSFLWVLYDFQNRQSFCLWIKIISFSVWIAFLCFTFLIALSRTSSKCRKEVMRWSFLPTQPLQESIQSLYYVRYGLFIDIPYQVQKVPVYFLFTKWLLNFV